MGTPAVVALDISKNDSTALTELVETLKINNLKPLPEYLFGKLAVDDLGTVYLPFVSGRPC